MKPLQRAVLLPTFAALSFMVLSVPVAAQQPAAAVRTSLTDQQKEQFLLNARVESSKEIGKGINNTRRASLSDGDVTHEAQISTVDISQLVFQPRGAPAELNFKDTYRYNIAAYRLSRLLGLHNVPVSVERRADNKTASFTWWVDDVMMDDAGRRKKTPDSWSPAKTSAQLQIMRVFDELVANTDRNLGNILWTTDGTMWMIDHTRAFRLHDKLKSPNILVRCERSLLAAMRGLTEDSVKAAVDESLTRDEVKAVLKRRDLLVQLFDAKIAQRTEPVVLFSFDTLAAVSGQ